jgi:hypothetical protein
VRSDVDSEELKNRTDEGVASLSSSATRAVISTRQS